MQEKSRNLVVGLTAMVGLTGVLFLSLLFGYIPAWLESGYVVRVQMNNASGLTEDSRVRFSGIDVGRVVEVRLRELPQRGVEIVTMIRDDVRVPVNSRVQAESPLLGGSPCLVFKVDHLPDEQLRQWLPTDGQATIQGESLTLVSQFTGELEAAFAEPTRRFDELTQEFEQLSIEWHQVGRNLNRLLDDRSVEQVDAGQAQGNLTTVVARADQRLHELSTAIDGLNQWLNDKQIKNDVAATMSQARQVVEGAHRLETRYMAIAEDLGSVVGSIRVMVERAQDGQGTVGKMFNDPALYDNLNDATQRLQVALDEFRLLVAKWKAEGLPVQF